MGEGEKQRKRERKKKRKELRVKLEKNKNNISLTFNLDGWMELNRKRKIGTNAKLEDRVDTVKTYRIELNFDQS